MIKCWAKEISDCCNTQSGEHIVSKSLFDNKMVTVKGFPWCKDEPKEVGINSIVTNCLCKKHNSELSDLDNMAGLFFDNFDKFLDIKNTREKKNKIHQKKYNKLKRWSKYEIHLDVKFLERWMLKTFCNVIISTKTDFEITKSIVELIYNKKSFYNKTGAGFVVKKGDNMLFQRGVSIMPVYLSNIIKGCRIDFYGLPFLCTWDKELPREASFGEKPGDNIKDIMYHPVSFNVDNLNIYLYFKW
jgi:hypothetical protein